MEVRMNTLTPELFLALYQSVGWEPPCIEQVRTAQKIPLQPSPVTMGTGLWEWSE